MRQVEDGSRAWADSGPVESSFEERASEVGQAAIVAGADEPPRRLDGGVDRLEDSNAAFEQARGAEPRSLRPDQGVEPLDADHRPAQPVGVVRPPGEIVRADQKPAGELGLDPRDQVAERGPGVGLARPVVGPPIARDDRRRRPLQIAIGLVRVGLRARVERGVEDGRLAGILEEPVQ